MKAYIFPSPKIPNLNYVLLEDGRFAGAFNEEIPPEVLDHHDTVLLSSEEARADAGLRQALDLNRRITAPASTIYVYGVPNHKGDRWPHFALADSGHPLAMEVLKPNRAKWALGVHGRCPYDSRYEAHFPDGYRVEWVPEEEVGRHSGLNLARVKNQMLADTAADGSKTAEEAEAADNREGADHDDE